MDHRHHCLAGHIAAEDQHISPIEFPCVEKLAPANIRPVNVCRKEEFCHRNILIWNKWVIFRRLYSLKYFGVASAPRLKPDINDQQIDPCRQHSTDRNSDRS